MAMTTGKVIQWGFDAVGVGSTFVESRKEGHGIVRSLGAAAVDQALWTVAAPLQFARMGVEVAGAIGTAAGEYARGAGKEYVKKANSQYTRQFGGNYVDSRANYTMRQRGVQAIRGSGQNANSVLGSEARTYFRGQY